MPGNQGRPNRQNGAVLAVSLILLVVLTLIGISSMQGTMLEEKMAGNVRDRNLAFQASESAIRDAENFIDGLVSLGNFNGTQVCTASVTLSPTTPW